MRVLVLSYLFPRPAEPWSGIFVVEQVAALRARGIDARVLWGFSLGMPVRRPEFAANWVPAPITGVPSASFQYRVPHRLWQLLAGPAYGRAALRAASTLRDEFPFDLVHAHTSFLDGHAASLIGDAFNVPVVLTEHSGPFSTQIDNPVKRRCTLRALHRADRLIAVSDFLSDQIKTSIPQVANRDITVIGNGISGEALPCHSPRAPDGKIIALWIGSFVPVKQPHMLLEAFSAAHRQNPRLHLRLAGDGPLGPELRRYAGELGLSERIEWLGPLDRQGINAALGEADFVVVSSQAETFSLATLEALVSGRPVLSTRCGGPESIIDSAKLGILTDNDQAGLTAGFLDMANSHHAFEPATLRKSALDRFAHDLIAERLGTLYQTLLSREST